MINCALSDHPCYARKCLCSALVATISPSFMPNHCPFIRLYIPLIFDVDYELVLFIVYSKLTSHDYSGFCRGRERAQQSETVFQYILQSTFTSFKNQKLHHLSYPILCQNIILVTFHISSLPLSSLNSSIPQPLHTFVSSLYNIS